MKVTFKEFFITELTKDPFLHRVVDLQGEDSLTVRVEKEDGYLILKTTASREDGRFGTLSKCIPGVPVVPEDAMVRIVPRKDGTKVFEPFWDLSRLGFKQEDQKYLNVNGEYFRCYGVVSRMRFIDGNCYRYFHGIWQYLNEISDSIWVCKEDGTPIKMLKSYLEEFENS